MGTLNMIQQQTLLKASDNSGAKTVKCIKVLGGFKRNFAFVGDLIIVSVVALRNRFRATSKVKKGELYKALIIRTKNKKLRKDGTMLFSSENSVCILNKQNKPIGSRILGSLPREFKTKWSKLMSISSGII